MSDSSSKKPGQLTLKPRVEATREAQAPRKAASSKTGARAHQRTRLQTEQRRSASSQTASPSPAQPRSATRPTGDKSRDPKQARQPRQSSRVAPARRQEHTRPANAPDSQETFAMFASCPRGLEQALCDELIAIGFKHAQAAQAGCRFSGQWSDVWRANLYSRLATRILVELAHGRIANEDDLRKLALGVNWERWLGPEKTLRVDTSAIRSPMQSLQYCNLVVKDSICDRLRDKEGSRPSIDTVRPDVRVHSFLSHDSATLYLDTSGESLFKRGWRLDKAEAPIRENLAAGLLALSGWQPDTALLDPFCGSGTILIEAAWIALNIPPGINRPFAFERLRVHDANDWQTMRQAATQSIKQATAAPIVGCDLSDKAIEAARRNAQRAGLSPEVIQWSVKDAKTVTPLSQTGMIVTNPPYGERLEIESELMQGWASQLKQQFAGWTVNVISADHSLPGAMRLKPKHRVPLFNGALDCRLFRFDMVSAQYTKGAQTSTDQDKKTTTR